MPLNLLRPCDGLSGALGEADLTLKGENLLLWEDAGSRMTFELELLRGRRIGLVGFGMGAWLVMGASFSKNMSSWKTSSGLEEP